MSKLSKYYKVTGQMMLEYVANQYDVNTQIQTTTTDYTIYTGKDDNIYYIDNSETQKFIKFPDESSSEYNFLGFNKVKSEAGKYTYDNDVLLKNNIDNLVKYKQDTKSGSMYYDSIRIHFIYGFLLDNLAGFTLQVKTNAKYLGPIQKLSGHTTTHYEFDSQGNPIFETVKNVRVYEQVKDNNGNIKYVPKTDDKGNQIYKTGERLTYNLKELTLLDIFFPKEALIIDDMVHWHTTPIYQNGSFYDRYVEFKVPSAYFLSVDAQKYGNGIHITSPNNYGYDQDNSYFYDENGNMYAEAPVDKFNSETWNKRMLTYTVLPDPQLIVNFATVSDTNITSTVDETTPTYYGSTLYSSHVYYSSKFYQDPINQIAIKYKSNSDYFNIRILEDLDNQEIIYYPVFGEGDNARDLNYEIFNRIETGEIPLITEGFQDSLSNMEDFYETYGDNAYKWIIYNDVTVTYFYTNSVNALEITNEDFGKNQYSQNFTNIIDYGKHDPETDGSFWKSHFVPRPPQRNNMTCKSIVIQYTCRLINRLTSAEAIRMATLTISDPTKYISRRVAINNVVTYKIVNQNTRNEIKMQNSTKESKDKIVRSYYDATNLVVKDMGNSNMYTQGQMTLYLKHSSSNYMFRLYNLNSDNVRIPYDLTGPFRYKLQFPTNDGSKISISPNTDSTSLNMGIGQLVFYITEEQVKRIMNVAVANRYFAIVTDPDNSDEMVSTLYEGKVSYYS